MSLFEPLPYKFAKAHTPKEMLQRFTLLCVSRPVDDVLAHCGCCGQVFVCPDCTEAAEKPRYKHVIKEASCGYVPYKGYFLNTGSDVMQESSLITHEGGDGKAPVPCVLLPVAVVVDRAPVFHTLIVNKWTFERLQHLWRDFDPWTHDYRIEFSGHSPGLMFTPCRPQSIRSRLMDSKHKDAVLEAEALWPTLAASALVPTLDKLKATP